MNILIADDEPDLLNALVDYFEDRGDAVCTAVNGAQALHIVKESQKPFDAILTDHRMPVMSGVELIEHLRRNGSEVPVVMMSGDIDALRYLEVGNQMIEFLHKPTSLTALEDTFSRFEPSQRSTDSIEMLEVPGEPTEHRFTLIDSSRILVVDDEPDICELMCELLSAENYDCESARDGVEAMQKWHNNADTDRSFDLLIVDLRMPRMDGAGLLQEIRKVDAFLPIIVLTGHGAFNDARAMLNRYQISDFLMKPLNESERMVFAVRNALEKAQLSQAFRNLTDELDQRVEERTRELALATSEAEEAKNVAEEANQEKSQFLSRMSHELRTPLNAIIGFSSIMGFNFDASTSASLKTSQGHILDAGRHLLTLVEDIMDVVKIEQNKLDIPLEHVDLDTIVNSSLSLVAHEAKVRGITLSYPGTRLSVVASSQRLQQVIVNMLTNAIKFNRDHGAVVVAAAVTSGGEIQVSVEDSGAGIDPGEYEAVFAPFSRLTYATTNEIGGTGIGMTLSKFLVEQRNGTIGFHPAPQAGTIFWIRLPAGVGAEVQVSEQESPPVLSTTLSRTILYIEDDMASRELFQLAFSGHPNLKLLMAGSAEQGISMAFESQPDLIFLDINLPGIDGIAALKILKDEPKLRSTPMIALSADALASQVDIAMKAGFDEYLTKPVEFDQLFRIVDER